MSQPLTILLADDDEDDRLTVRDAFARHRLANSLQTVNDGVELLAYLRGEGAYTDAPRPDIILLDLNMPRMNGLEALRAMRADPTLRYVPVIVLTTSAAEEDVVKSYTAGANSYLTKPVEFEALVTKLGALGQYWLQIVELPRLA